MSWSLRGVLTIAGIASVGWLVWVVLLGPLLLMMIRTPGTLFPVLASVVLGVVGLRLYLRFRPPLD